MDIAFIGLIVEIEKGERGKSNSDRQRKEKCDFLILSHRHTEIHHVEYYKIPVL